MGTRIALAQIQQGLGEMKTTIRKPVLLIILDGFGVNPGKHHNAIHHAHTPRLDEYFAQYPITSIQASGHAVGLPDGQMGNSEVGHLTLGSGSVIRQDLVKISDSIEQGGFYENDVLLAAISNAAARQRPVHLYGLISDGGVHSHLDHVLALIELCRRQGARPLLHAFTDGRDVPPQSIHKYLPEIEKALADAGGGIATISGRYFAMDRDSRWDRTERAWRAMILGQGRKAKSSEQAIAAAYDSGETDEFIKPTVLPGWQHVDEEDVFISFNFRKDRPKQITAALGHEQFAGFDRGDSSIPRVTCMMPYDKDASLPYAFEVERPDVTLAEVIAQHGIEQLHCAETEKYAHVTYFFNGGRHDPHEGEKHLLIPSPKVATYNMQPEMSAPEISKAVLNAMHEQHFGFIVVNFANGDMVGHTADWFATVRAVEALDNAVGNLLDVANDLGYSVILTADHGNCEELVDKHSGAPHTQHTCNPVPCMIMDEMYWILSNHAGLSSIAPTVLHLMGIEQPETMTGKSLLLTGIERDLQPDALPGVA
jgi:2,3-bisphosphoglycerate-independent phosphoglycerate mutase